MSIGSKQVTTAKAYQSSRSNRNWITPVIISVLVLASAAASILYFSAHHSQQVDSKQLKVSGRIEGDESHIATVVPGRVLQVYVKEGQNVKKGELLVQLDDSPIQNGLKQANQAVAMAAKMVSTVESQRIGLKNKIGAMQNKIEEPVAQPEKKRGLGGKFLHVLSTPVRAVSAPFSKGAAKEQIKKQIGQAQINSSKLMLDQSGAQTLMVQSELEKSKMTRKQLASRLEQYKIFSPIDGTVTTCAAQPGDVVAQGQILLMVVNPKAIYMRGFIPEGEIAKLKIGQEARVFLDSQKGKTLAAHLSSIDKTASFTPENVYFKEDRVRQVFGLKLAIDKPDGSAKPGMPCDAEIDLSKAVTNDGG